MEHNDEWARRFNTKPMADRQIDQLIGFTQGILADGVVNQAEAETLQNWLQANHVRKQRFEQDLVESHPHCGLVR